jgi:hypothetical protein
MTCEKCSTPDLCSALGCADVAYERERASDVPRRWAAAWRDDALEAAAAIAERYQADPWIARDIRSLKTCEEWRSRKTPANAGEDPC